MELRPSAAPKAPRPHRGFLICFLSFFLAPAPFGRPNGAMCYITAVPWLTFFIYFFFLHLQHLQRRAAIFDRQKGATRLIFIKALPQLHFLLAPIAPLALAALGCPKGATRLITAASKGLKSMPHLHASPHKVWKNSFSSLGGDSGQDLDKHTNKHEPSIWWIFFNRMQWIL